MKTEIRKKSEIANENHLVTKSNSLIEAKYKLTLQQQRLICILASKINPNDKEFETYTFNVKEICDLLQIESKNYYQELPKITKSLIENCIQIKENNKIIQMSWLSSAIYQSGKVTLRFAEELRPYLLQLKECFTSYCLKDILQLKSKYAIRLYELSRKNELLGNYIYELEDLREKLGVEKNELKLWGHFKLFALEKAISEINEKTNLYVSYKAIKDNKKITAIELIIKSKKETKNEFKSETLPQGTLGNLISLLPQQYHKTESIIKNIKKYLKKHGELYCKRNILYTIKHAKKNFKGFLSRALENDWGLSWWEDYIKQENIQKQNEQIMEKEILLQKLKEVEQKEKMQKINEYLQTLNQQEVEEIKKQIYYKHLKNLFDYENVPEFVWKNYVEIK